ncbi:uncharacterized protein C1orf87 isoform X2 [Acanthopagrus latus]|uniref:uncharacterized protein C1orf87 isoform X2 n=1 Tax=Acanthopagrus latus TaxID=8177 RepID=UPI00187CF28D|nr:uncharacterized protein C1orf87 isoform X2 [Acanthopagrus latus]
MWNPDRITCIMAQKNTSGANPIPRLVVKIVGSKQVKQFIEEPRQDSGDVSEREDSRPVEAACDGDFKKPPEKQVVMVSSSDRKVENRVDSALWAVIQQAPDRRCVTAPSGDRSRSYIHPRTPHSCDPRAAEVLEISEEKGVSEEADKAELSSAVREELSDWQLCSLRSAEDEVAALDLTFSGTLHRSEITHLFLKHHVPLKLPTFSLLLQMFSGTNDPEQIHYRNLLQFVRSSAFPDELHKVSEVNPDK